MVSNLIPATLASEIGVLDNDHSIVQFLERPTQIWVGNLDTNMKPIATFPSDTGPGPFQPFIKVFNLPGDILANGKKLDKVNSFQWLKADLVVRFIVNANPYVAGRYWIGLAPHDEELTELAMFLAKGRAGITSYPGIELDLQTSTSAEIKVPWTSVYEAMSLTETGQNYLQLYLVALTPLYAPDNSTKVPIQAFGWFENVEIRGPTPIPAVLQIGNEASPPISEIASGVSKAANILAPLPVVGTVASSVSWIADITSKVASIFGWSRPIEGSHATPMAQIPARGYSQLKAIDDSTVLGFSNDNSIVEKESNFLEDVDEMSIEHVCSRPAVVDLATWSTTTQPSEVLSIQCCGPLVDASRKRVWTDELHGSVYEVFDLNLFEMTASFFHMWRADLHFRISVVRTPFHVGRLEIFFVPNAYVTAADGAIYDATNTYRHIMDITENSEMEFVVPYMHKNVMCNMGSSMQWGQHPDDDQAIGSLVIRALTPLNCPSTVSQSIGINVWKWATNVAFSSPLPYGLQVYDPVINGPLPQSELQINVSNLPLGAKSVAFGSSNTPNSILDATSTVGGEVCLNLRQLTRAHRVWQGFLQNEPGTDLGLNVNYGMKGIIGLMSSIYAFYRGGLSIKLFHLSTGDGINTWLNTSLRRVIDTNGYYQGFDSVRHTTYPQLNPVHEVAVPFYSKARRGLCNRAIAFDYSTAGKVANSRFMPLLHIDSGTTLDLETTIAGKDDFTFGFLVGPCILGRLLGPA